MRTIIISFKWPLRREGEVPSYANRCSWFAAVAIGCLANGSMALRAYASDPEFELRIQAHQFTPSEVHIPAGVKFRLTVHNDDASPEEFDSHDLNREKIVLGNSKAVLFVGPLRPGRYTFVGEYNASTAKGALVVE